MKKNVLKNLVFIMGIYLGIIIFHNISPIIKNIILSSNEKIIIFNKSIILSLIISCFVVVYKNVLFRKKLYIWIIILFLLLCNFAEGFFLDFKVYPFIILYIYLLLMTFYTMLKANNGFEISMVYSFSILILSAFAIGLFGLLVLFKYVMLMFAIYMLWFIIKNAKSCPDKFQETMNNLFSQGFVIFNILWMLAIFFGAGLYVHSFDEYSHWAYDAKAMIYYSKFGNSQEIMLHSRSYAPIFTVWHYIVSIFGGFSEHNLYVGLNILVSIYLLPAFIYLKNNNLFIKILGVIAIIFGCYMFGGVYSYSTLYVDYAITAIFSSSVILYFVSKDKNINVNKLLILLIIILTLGKPNGFVIAFSTLLIIFINELIDSNIVSAKKFFKMIGNFIVIYKFVILAIILTFLAWRGYTFFMNKITNDYYDFSLVSRGLRSDLKYKFNYDFIRSFFGGVIKSFDIKCIGGLIPLTLFQYIIISITVFYLIVYKTTNSAKKAMFKILPFMVSYIVFFFLTILSMFIAMNLYEAGRLASFGRYLNWYNVSIIIFVIVLLLRIESKNNIIFKTVFLTYIVISISFSNLFGFIVNPIKSESYNVSVERNKKVDIVKNNTPESSMIYIIDQNDIDGIMAMWYVRYYTFPRKTNASSSAINWKIRTEKNKDDLSTWGFTAQSWAKHLIKYKFDYVFLYSSDDDFFEQTKFMYDDYKLAREFTLFKIEYMSGTIKLLPIA